MTFLTISFFFSRKTKTEICYEFLNFAHFVPFAMHSLISNSKTKNEGKLDQYLDLIFLKVPACGKKLYLFLKSTFYIVSYL